MWDMGKKIGGRGVGPGRGVHGKRTSLWVFVLHLVLVFSATWGTMLAFSSGHRVVGSLLAGTWVVLFIITSLDNVRVAAFEWTEIYILVVLDSLGITNKARRQGQESRGDVPTEPPLPDLDVDRG